MKRSVSALHQIVLDTGTFNLVGRALRQGGVDYQVFPCVLLVEGVHHGATSDAAVYYSQRVLEQSAPFWNNMPVTVGHPINEQGDYILCNHDGTIRQQWEVGRLTNSRFEDGKIKADVMLNVSLINQVSPQLLPFIQNGGALDVSSGLLSADDGVSGTWNGEQYASSVVEIVPDHLALLPNQRGACSWSDGCGIRFNLGHTSKSNADEKKSEVLLINELSLENKIDQIWRYVDGLDVRNAERDQLSRVNFLRAIYNDYFIYRQENRQFTSNTQPQSTTTLLKQGYEFDSADNLVITGESIEVVEEIIYRPKVVTTNTSIKENKEMPTDQGKMKCKDASTPAMKAKCGEMMVNALIAEEKTSFVETDREWLMSMNIQQLEKLVANMGDPEDGKTPVTPTTPAVPGSASASVVLSESEMMKKFLGEAPAPIRALFNGLLKEADEKRTGLISRIKAHEGNKLNEESLKLLDNQTLEGIVALIPEKKVQANDFSLRGQLPITNAGKEEEPYIPSTFSFGKK